MTLYPALDDNVILIEAVASFATVKNLNCCIGIKGYSLASYQLGAGFGWYLPICHSFHAIKVPQHRCTDGSHNTNPCNILSRIVKLWQFQALDGNHIICPVKVGTHIID